MCQYSAEDGFSNDWHLVHLGSRAVGGAALVIAEATAVSPEGRISPEDLGIWKDEHVEGLSRICKFLKGQKSVPGIQLAHAGRKASHRSPWKGADPLPPSEGGWKTLAPSAHPYKEGVPESHAFSLEEISLELKNWESAIKRAVDAGFEVIELYAAHGYLLHEFLSPLSNKRNDQYGGSFDNRIRFLLEVVGIARRIMPESMPLFVRISATDYAEGGWTMEDSLKLVKILKEEGVDLIDCSSGGIISGVKIEVFPMYQVPFAERIRRETGIPTGAVGMITTGEQVESILAEGKADMVMMARELLRNPYFPLMNAKAMDAKIDWPSQYLRARD